MKPAIEDWRLQGDDRGRPGQGHLRRDGRRLTVLAVRCKSLSILGSIFVASATLAGVAVAASGDLDSSFSGDGRAVANFTAGNDFANGVAIQADRKIVAAGRAGGKGGRFALVRYEADGTLDTTFGGDGKVTTNFTAWDDFANGVAIQADGKIVAAGAAQAFTRFALARYNRNGTLDTTFGGDGKVTTAFRFGGGAEAVALQPDGRIVAAGAAGEFGPFVVVRYTSRGKLDATFGGDGTVTTNMGQGEESATAVTIQPNGKIVVAGYTDVPHEFGDTFGPGRFALARYRANGALDSGFGGDGKVKTRFRAGGALAMGVAIQADGKIVAAGEVKDRFAIARYNANGTLDPSFSGNGRATTNFTTGFDAAHGVAIQPDGKIVAAGEANSDSFALARYRANGALDPSFSGDGKTATDFSTGRDSAQGVAIQADGKIVAAGYAGVPRGRFAVARYLGG
jgi:uncharacterized delta-60 repeat protein